jgi:L-histidine Nalpha-methyltransferase
MSTPPSAALVADCAGAQLLTPFAADVRAGLLAQPKRLPPRWFYDALGSALFEAICRLPWYRITRAELALLSRHRDEITARFGSTSSIVELGVGSGEKLSLLVGAAAARALPRVHLIDVSPRALEMAAGVLAPYEGLFVTTHEATYEDGLHRAAASRWGRQVVLFLGSNLGNFDPPSAVGLVAQIAAVSRPDDLLLLGLDLVKPQAELLRAYDDPLGVTAAFDKNVLQRMNVELGAEFDLAAFAHEARWDAETRRIEMHLVSLRLQEVSIPGARLTVRFAKGESIWTESSYKFDLEGIHALGRRAGFAIDAQWIDPDAGFALTLFRKA